MFQNRLIVVTIHHGSLLNVSQVHLDKIRIPPAHGLKGTRFWKYRGVEVVEITKICVYLENPVGLYKQDCTYVGKTRIAFQEGFILEPRDDIM